MKHVLEYVVLSVSPAASIPKKNLLYLSCDMKQIAYVQHGTSAFMQAFVVVHLKTDPHKNQLFDVKKKKKTE